MRMQGRKVEPFSNLLSAIWGFSFSGYLFYKYDGWILTVVAVFINFVAWFSLSELCKDLDAMIRREHRVSEKP
jgi:hypothetical protein